MDKKNACRALSHFLIVHFQAKLQSQCHCVLTMNYDCRVNSVYRMCREIIGACIDLSIILVELIGEILTSIYSFAALNWHSNVRFIGIMTAGDYKTL